ncbi:MAG: T9SS type A sorting domain-containing protein [Bacteroidetes bacterium]|nr:T9SS type A sorting domain-containing protein [Bacteroidota bacterium]
MKIYATIFAFTFCFLFEKVAAFNPSLKPSFIENVGQFHNQNGNSVNNLKFVLQSKGLLVQLKTTGISYELKEKGKIRRVDLEFVNANIGIKIYASNKNPGILQYLSKQDPTKSYSASTFQKVVYENVFNGIDLECFSGEGETAFKYNFIVHPGANPANIQLVAKGANSCKTNSNGELIIMAGKEAIKERIPESYLLSSGESEKKEVKVNYVVKKNRIGFELEAYDYTKTLVIDPLVWSTYYGGSGAEQLFDMQSDQDSNIYIVGSTSSPNIATTGAHQISLAGSQDVFMAKFTKNGILVWATYYGGSGADFCSGFRINASGELILHGHSNSSTGITSLGSYQPNLVQVNSYDAFISAFDTSGIFKWGTYFGGSNNDQASGMTIDPLNGQITIVGQTSSTDLPLASLGFQPTNAGSTDYYLARFTSKGFPIWSTYYGGPAGDQYAKITTDASGNIYMAGYTPSQTGLASANAYKTIQAPGSMDGIFAIFDSTGNRRYATFFGTALFDQFYDITTDGAGKLFIVGETFSIDSIATPGAYQTVHQSPNQRDAMLLSFDTSGALLWSTYFGGENQDLCRVIRYINDGHLIFGGYTYSKIKISSVDAVKPAMTDAIDGFYGIMGLDGAIKYASYFGGNNFDLLSGVYAWSRYKILLSGVSISDSLLSTPGAYVEKKPGLGYDFFLARIHIDLPVAGPCDFKAGFTMNQTIQCNKGNSFVFKDTTTVPGVSRIWDFDNGIYGSNQTENISFVFGPKNYFDVKLTLSNGVCSSEAVNRVYIIANPDVKTITGSTNVRRLELATYSVPFTNGSTYQWIYDNGIGTSRSNTINIRWTSKGTTNLKVIETNNGPCVGDTISLPITIDAAVGEEEMFFNEISVYPNPLSSKLFIDLPQDLRAQIKLYDNLGKEQLSESTMGNTQINTENLTPGIYFLLVQTENNQTYRLKVEVRR